MNITQLQTNEKLEEEDFKWISEILRKLKAQSIKKCLNGFIKDSLFVSKVKTEAFSTCCDEKNTVSFPSTVQRATDYL